VEEEVILIGWVFTVFIALELAALAMWTYAGIIIDIRKMWRQR
jgi:hypothetical protein